MCLVIYQQTASRQAANYLFFLQCHIIGHYPPLLHKKIIVKDGQDKNRFWFMQAFGKNIFFGEFDSAHSPKKSFGH
jgi:hypothetical protein